ncbi:ATP-binding protein [Sedimentisphaera salicampi]|uniref:Uncharacterized protein n=1 Tax=Sedimentisphaera salicampi TaxID=1941349 RepID=A0A1W6LM98_9BACT|nr:ATP-binding protein [Sedimentisphaera salicampi]ARN56876.1 hypothetical protein STSP1_01268 [Sedimentisphaera salicampi]
MDSKDIDKEAFAEFMEKEFDIAPETEKIERSLKNLNLMRDGSLNLAGALLFGKRPHIQLPAFIVKCVCYPGKEISANNYIESKDIKGTIPQMFEGVTAFLLRNIRWIQNGKDINSIGDPEIPRIALVELVVNALIHRDYFISAPVRIFIFSDRVEIISPGHLPNNLTVENIKNGNSNIRNPILASFAAKLLPYRGLGSGIRRALKAYPDIQFEDDRDGNLFKCTLIRKTN